MFTFLECSERTHSHAPDVVLVAQLACRGQQKTAKVHVIGCVVLSCNQEHEALPVLHPFKDEGFPP